VRCDGSALEEWQAGLGAVVAEVLAAEAVPVVLGGGHETSFGHFLGYVSDRSKVSIINIDAHHDIRVSARATSGTPFRQAHDHASGLLASYQILGAQPHAISAPYLADLAAMGARVAFRGEIASPGAAQVAREALDRISRDSSILITLDLDAVDQAFAPGVSAPCTNGLFPQELLDLLGVLLADRRVSSFDVVELNPAHDWDGQTARLAALAIFRALAMFTRRRD
jgi:formiminoglutamase